MAADVISALNLDKEPPNARVFVVKEINGCEGSFIASCILAHQVKRKAATVLVTFHQLLEHYQNVGLRMGYNLRNQQTADILRVVSPAELYLQKLIEGDSTESFLDDILTVIHENITSLVVEHGSQGPVCVYIDGTTHLFDLGYSLKSINAFVRKIIQVVRECNECFVVFNCTVATEHDDSDVLANLLSHSAHSVVQCESLPSGRSAEVSGHLNVKHPGLRFRPDTSHLMHVASTKYHFRLFDRGVKLFAPGAVGL